MIEIDWNKDYKGEFICPQCEQRGLGLYGRDTTTKRRMFICYKCGRRTAQFWNIKIRKKPLKINWKNDYKIGEFICPNTECNSRNIHMAGFNGKNDKKQFKCKDCNYLISQSIDLLPNIISKYTTNSASVEPFNFINDKWDLRSLIPSINKRDGSFYTNFEKIEMTWFRKFVKNYILHLCKCSSPLTSVQYKFSALYAFSCFLADRKITDESEINRNSIIDYLSWEKSGNTSVRKKLGILRRFFLTGTNQNWFEVDHEIIRDSDYPKKPVANPDPISDILRQNIEDNLHILPEPIARMWLITFFTAMRPDELALLKKDCLVQDGSLWKVVWRRRKGNDQHEVPITRTIAKVIQEQQDYIQELFGNSWDYLFCHYQGLSKSDPSQPKLKPIKKVIAASQDPLTVTIRSLIKNRDIKDENGTPAKFSARLVRPTRLTQLFEQGHDLAIVSAWAGHKHLATTALHYTYVSCDLIEKEAGHIQKALFNTDGQQVYYESLPKSFWKNPRAHQLELPGDHINTPIYGYCGLPLDETCDKFRSCYTCHQHFVAIPEKLPLYIKTLDELRGKETRAKEAGADVLVEQYKRQADQLDKIITSLEVAK